MSVTPASFHVSSHLALVMMASKISASDLPSGLPIPVCAGGCSLPTNSFIQPFKFFVNVYCFSPPLSVVFTFKQVDDYFFLWLPQ